MHKTMSERPGFGGRGTSPNFQEGGWARDKKMDPIRSKVL